MMTPWRAFLTVRVLGAAGGPANTTRQAVAQLQGEWQLVWAERSGQRFETTAGGILVVKDRTLGSKTRGVFASFTLDQRTTPKPIDVTSLTGE